LQRISDYESSTYIKKVKELSNLCKNMYPKLVAKISILGEKKKGFLMQKKN